MCTEKYYIPSDKFYGAKQEINIPFGENVAIPPGNLNREIFLFRVISKSSFRLSVLHYVTSGAKSVISSQSPVFI